MKYLFCLVLLVIGYQLFSQESNLIIHQSSDIERLLQKHIKVNEIHPYTNGYRVQLYSVGGANSKEKANTYKNEFLAIFPETLVYVIYQAPYFKVRIGNFRTQIEALAYLQQIKLTYPFAFVVIDEIEVPKNN